MQLDQMRSLLKALVVLFALAAGFPAAAWAHAGHEHGTPRSYAHNAPVAGVAADPDSLGYFVRWHLRAQGSVISFASTSSGERIAHAAKRVGGIPLGLVGPQLHPMPADEPVAPADQNNCCCGGIACHAGMAAPPLTLTDPWTLGAKVELPPVLAFAGAVPGGLERPPRGSFPL